MNGPKTSGIFWIRIISFVMEMVSEYYPRSAGNLRVIKKRIPGFLFLFLVSICSYSQDCQSIRVPQHILAGNKIREIKIYTADTLTKEKKVLQHIFLDKTGYVYRQLIYDDPDNKGSHYQEECSCSGDSLWKVNKLSEISSEGLTTHTWIDSLFFNERKELIRNKFESWNGEEYESNIHIIDPSAPSDINFEKILIRNGDTIQYKKYLKNNLTEDITTREKINGILVERKVVLEYRNGVVFSYKEYSNGKLIISKDHKELEEFFGLTRADPEAMPLFEKRPQLQDTVVTQLNSWKEFGIKGIATSKSTKSLLKIIHYDDFEKKHISFIEMYYTNGLLHSVRSNNTNTIELYEYISF
jgi:hypothetical protein